MNERTPEELIAEMKKRISEKQFEELFTAGCCFHFALCSFRRGIGALAWTRSHNPKRKGHVFVITNEGLAFDFKGYQDLSAIKAKFSGYGNDPHFCATAAEIEGDILSLGWPSTLNDEIFAIANDIVTQKMANPNRSA
jgi:hypothetical protein